MLVRIIIHLNTRILAILARSSRHLLGQTTHCSKPGPIITDPKIHKNQHARPDAPKPIHPDKEQFCSRQLSWEQTSKFPHRRPLQERRTRNLKLDFPCKYNPPNSPQNSWWRWTESNRRPPACKAGALPIELHPQNRRMGRAQRSPSRLPTLTIHGGPGRT